MNTIDVKEQVRQALAQEWPAFVSAHPHMAAAMDETLLIEPAMQSLADDPDYQSAMQTAAEVGSGAEVVGSIISKLVRNWLKQLV